VPGHEGRTYRVIVRRAKGISVECHQVHQYGEIQACPGNSKGLCYHSLGALRAMAREAKLQLAFVESVDVARKLLNLHPDGKAVKVTSFQGPGCTYMVTWPNKH